MDAERKIRIINERMLRRKKCMMWAMQKEVIDVAYKQLLQIGGSEDTIRVYWILKVLTEAN